MLTGARWSPALLFEFPDLCLVPAAWQVERVASALDTFAARRKALISYFIQSSRGCYRCFRAFHFSLSGYFPETGESLTNQPYNPDDLHLIPSFMIQRALQRHLPFHFSSCFFVTSHSFSPSSDTFFSPFTGKMYARNRTSPREAFSEWLTLLMKRLRLFFDPSLEIFQVELLQGMRRKGRVWKCTSMRLQRSRWRNGQTHWFIFFLG